MGEHANTRPLGFKDVADYIIIDGEIFFAPSIFLESKSPEIIDLFLDKFLNYMIELRVGETVAEQVFKALVIGWDDSFLFQEQLNGYFLELSNFSANGSICTKIATLFRNSVPNRIITLAITYMARVNAYKS